MDSLLGNQSLPPSISQGLLLINSQNPDITAHSSSGGVSEYGRSSHSILCANFSFPLLFLCLTFLVSVWVVMSSVFWIPARPTVVHCMLVFGLATCWGLLSLYSTGKHLHCCLLEATQSNRHSDRELNKPQKLNRGCHIDIVVVFYT